MAAHATRCVAIFSPVWGKPESLPENGTRFGAGTAGKGVCMEAATIIRGGAVLLKEGLKTGWGVKLRDGLIAEVGPNETLSAQAQDTVIEATDQVILPGFINGHNHM